MGEDRAKETRPASLERIMSSDAYTAALKQESASLTVVIETWQGVKSYEEQLPGEVSALFQKLHAEIPRDLLFRAFRDDVELAWLGLEGVAVRLGAGEDKAIPATYCGVRHVGEAEEQWDMTVDEIWRDGWVIYRKLRSVPPVERA